VSIEQAKNQLQLQDRLLKSFPEVDTVFGKIGRSSSPTDPAPVTMAETTVRLRPRAKWRHKHVDRWWSGWGPGWLDGGLRRLWPDERAITWDELTTEMNARMRFPGWTNAFTMPIKTRVDMLTTGIRTPVGIKIFGKDLDEIESVGTALERVLSPLPGTRSVLYERNLGGLYVDIVPDRDRLQRYGLTVGDVERTVEAAVGGTTVATTIEGRARFSVSVRYPQDLRADVEAVKRVLVAVPPMEMGAAPRNLPLGELADVKIAGGPPMVRDEGGLLVGYVYVDIDQGKRDVGGYVNDAKRAVADAEARGDLKLPTGTFLKWTGQYELMQQMAERMRVVIPLTLLVVFVLLFLYFKNVVEVLIVLLSIPFALVGSVWLLWLLDYRLSTAVWVGVIALVGLATQTGVVMILYIDTAYERRKRAGKIRDLDDIIWAHMEGTVQRVRPKLMTVGTMLVGLVPLLWATGSGADVMKRLAAPMVGGLLSSAFLTLEIIPVIYTYWRREQLLHERLVAAAPAWRASLRASALVVGLGWAMLAALGVAAIYVTVPAHVVRVAATAATLAIVGGAALYLVERPRASRLIWPPATRPART
jgi:Cu(I)/Ag(I) efflux system membrane protein CusA/SilA